ncbi:MAG: glycohydrolase toxin TNT-related protein [Bacteroidia bacterium]
MGAKAAQMKVASPAAAPVSAGTTVNSAAVQRKEDPAAEKESAEADGEGKDKEGEEPTPQVQNPNDLLALGGFKSHEEDKDKKGEQEGEKESLPSDKSNGEGEGGGSGSSESAANEGESSEAEAKSSESEESNESEGSESEQEQQAGDQPQDQAAGESEGAENEEQSKEGVNAAESKDKDQAKDKVKDSKDKAADDKSTADSGGGDAGSGAANGGGADSAAGGGGGGGGGSAEGASISGGGAGSGGGGGGQVPAAKVGNFGEGQEPELTLVNKAAVKDFDPNNIIKDNGDGTYLVISSSVASPEAPQEAPAQLAPDPTKDKPLKKKIPQSQSKEAMAANRQRVQQSTSQFDATASAKISAFEQTKSNISTQVLAGAEAAKGAILSAAETEKARVQAGVAAEKQTLSAGAERIKGEVRTKLQAALAAVKAAADAARTSVQTEYDTQDKAFVTLEGTQKRAFTDAFKKAKQDLIDIGEKYAKLAIKEGEDQAARYAGEPVPEMGTGAKILKGGSYEQDRHDAKVKGAKDAGEGYAKSFRDNAKQKSEELNGGEAEMHKYVTDSVRASRDAIQQRKQTALDEIKTQEEGAGIRLNQQSESTILNIDGAAQQAQISLDEQMNHSLSMIETTAVAKAAAVDEAAQNFIKNLEFQFQGSVDALYAQKNAAIEFISNQNNPSVSMAEKHFAAALAGLDESITTTGQMITEGITGSVAGLNDTATESATELNTAASTAIDSAAQTVNGTITGLEGQRDGFGTTAQSIQDGTTGAIKQAEDSAKKEMQDQYKAVTDDFNKAKTSLDAKMGENSRGFDNNIKAEYDKCPKGIEDKANEAKEAVRPRWVRWLLVAIDILVVLIITAIVLAAMASGVGILGLLLIGAVAGAAGGALKYCARVGLTSEKWDTGKFFKETLDGAFDGVNIAVGLIPGVGPAVLVGMGALGGAFKYGTDVIFTPGKKFSWGELAGKTLLGGVQGAFGAALGHYGNSWGAAIAGKFGGVTTKVFGAPIIEKAFSWTFQSVGNWVMGGGSAVVDNWITTGVWDTSKFSEAMTLEALVTAAGTTVVGDWGAARSKGIETSMGPKKIGLTGWSEPTTNTNSNAKGSTTTTETTNSNNESTNTKTSTNEAPVNNETTNTKTSTNEAPVNNETTNTKTSTNEAPVNNETTNNKGSNHENTTPENTGPKPKDTVNAPESNQPVKLTGKEQAAAKGYPEAPPGYEWVAGRDGEPYIRRTRGGTDERVQVRFDPESGTFKPTTEAPTGYHWELVNGEFQPVANSNAADTLPPIVYDPVTGGFKEAATGKPFNGDLTQLPVRGQDFEGFQKSISEKDRIALQADPQAMQQAYEMFATKDWAGLEALFNAKGIKWPPNRGFISVTDGVLPVGSKFDRFGGWTDEHGAFQDKGTFVAPYGASFEGRALPDSTKTSPFNGYEVLKPIPMKEGPAIPWFGKEGGGMQYELSMSINDLIAGGYIKKIDAPDLNAISGPKPTTETNTSGNKETTTPKVEETTTSGNKENTTPNVEETNVSGNKENAKDAVEPISNWSWKVQLAPRKCLASEISHMTKSSEPKALKNLPGILRDG